MRWSGGAGEGQNDNRNSFSPVGSSCSLKREGGDFVKGEVPGSAGDVSADTLCTRVVGRIVDLALGDESGVNVAVLNARVRYKTDAGLVKAKWVPLNISLEGTIVYVCVHCMFT